MVFQQTLEISNTALPNLSNGSEHYEVLTEGDRTYNGVAASLSVTKKCLLPKGHRIEDFYAQYGYLPLPNTACFPFLRKTESSDPMCKIPENRRIHHLFCCPTKVVSARVVGLEAEPVDEREQ